MVTIISPAKKTLIRRSRSHCWGGLLVLPVSIALLGTFLMLRRRRIHDQDEGIDSVPILIGATRNKGLESVATKGAVVGAHGSAPLAHVFKFDLSSNAWTPNADFLDYSSAQGDDSQQQAIDSALFNSADGTLANDAHIRNRSSFLGFVRAAKTGSSSLLSFLRQEMHSLDDYLVQKAEFVEFAEKWQAETDEWQLKLAPNCMFGQAPVDVYSPRGRGGWEDSHCPHMRYSELIHYWAKTLPFLVPSRAGHHVQEAAVKREAYTVSLDTFTMVRDPFDRLVSYFFYVKNIYPAWRNASTEAQNERIQAGDLAGWMELLHTEGGSRAMEIPYQYKYLSDDVDKAISLIQGDSPRILTLLNECFSASVRLLVDKKSSFFPQASPEYFLNSSNAHRMVNENSYKGLGKDILKRLRQNAMVWFEDDFDFYRAAVKQFKRHLASSNINSSEAKTCRYWDDRLRENHWAAADYEG